MTRWNSIVFLDHPGVVLCFVLFAENDTKVDVEAFKKKIKHSQVRTVFMAQVF